MAHHIDVSLFVLCERCDEIKEKRRIRTVFSSYPFLPFFPPFLLFPRPLCMSDSGAEKKPNFISAKRLGTWKGLVKANSLKEAHEAVEAFFAKDKPTDQVACEWCSAPKSFTAGDILDHILTQHVEYKHLACGECDNKLCTQKQLNRHVAQAHKKSAEPPTPSKPAPTSPEEKKTVIKGSRSLEQSSPSPAPPSKKIKVEDLVARKNQPEHWNFSEFGKIDDKPVKILIYVISDQIMTNYGRGVRGLEISTTSLQNAVSKAWESARQEKLEESLFTTALDAIVADLGAEVNIRIKVNRLIINPK